MQTPQQFTIRVYGILNYNNHILVSDEYIRGNYFTKFPGGGLEIGEGTRECLIREFKEETGLAVTVGEHIYTTDYYVPSAFNPNHQIIAIYYWANCNHISTLQTSEKRFNFSAEITANPQASAESFRWININNITTNDVDLPIDKVVVDILLKKQLLQPTT